MRAVMVILTLAETLTLATVDGETTEFNSDTRHVVSCENKAVTLQCQSEQHVLAIKEASYFETGHVCDSTPPLPPSPPRDPDIEAVRHSLLFAVNRRCAGNPSCSFELKRDRPNVWRPGIMYISYTCFPGDRGSRFCSEKLGAGSGIITNPGYPMFYPGDVNCSWVVETDPGQTLQLTLYDLNIRGSRSGGECRDFVRITEGAQVLLITCGDIEQPVNLLSTGEKVTVTLWSEGQPLYPMRGLFLHYSAVGCKTPPAPRDGYLVQRNSSHALFTCCVNFVMADDGQHQRWLFCEEEGAQWNDTLPSTCVEKEQEEEEEEEPSTSTIVAGPEEDRLESSGTGEQVSTARETGGRDLGVRDMMPPVRPVVTDSDTLAMDMLIPLGVLIALVLINAVVLIVIYRLRQRSRRVARRTLSREQDV